MPLGGLLTAGIVANVAGGVIGNAASAGDRDKASKNQRDAVEAISNLSGPDADRLKVDLERYQQTGELSPELQNVIELKQSEMGAIKTDPRLAQAQMSALQKLQQQGTGGLQAQDKAALADIMAQTAGQANAGQAAALQAMQQRGTGGAGAELAARLSAAQGGANAAMKAGLDLQGQAAQRALQAIASSGQLGQSMQSQEFTQKAQQAAAQDAVNRFNAANQQQVLGMNTATKNKAQADNLFLKQDIANRNVDTSQKEALQHVGAEQQVYQNQENRAKLLAGVKGEQAKNDLANASATQGMWSGIGSAVGQGATAFAGAKSAKDTLDAYKSRTEKM